MREALADAVTALRRDIATMTAAVAAAEYHLAVETSILPQRTRVDERSLHVRYLRVADPAELFDWLHRRDMTVTGPTVEEHLVDAEGASATVLEIPVAQNREPGTRRSR